MVVMLRVYGRRRSELIDQDRPAEGRRRQALTIPAANESELFDFNPPNDPANDDEALQERAAIMAESNGWDAATALQEARWEADRERCWRGFLRNAGRILEAPAHTRDALLGQYQAEATRRYGQAAGANMAQSLRGWVRAKEVH